MVQFVQVKPTGKAGSTRPSSAVGAGRQQHLLVQRAGRQRLCVAALSRRDTLSRRQLPQPPGRSRCRATDSGRLTGWLQTPAGGAYGARSPSTTTGSHDDGEASDGLSGPAVHAARRRRGPICRSRATIGGSFKRSDPTPSTSSRSASGRISIRKAITARQSM